MTPDQAREVLTRRLAELTDRDPPMAVHLRQGDAPAHAIDDEVAAFQPSDAPAPGVEFEDPDELRAALQRLDLGTWGACASCGEAIDAERLTRAPYTRFCASCV